MSLLIGLVGKPSAGKSTFFKAATLMDVAIANYPFTTIKPNRGAGFVRVKCVHEELKKKFCNPREGVCLNGTRYVPVELLDVAGLVPGAHEGKGMGNQFLDDLRQAHALIHIVDFSGGTNSDGEVVPLGSHDPIKDIEFLEEELDYWFMDVLKRVWTDIHKKSMAQEAVIQAVGKQLSGLMVTAEMAKNAPYPNKSYKEWNDEDMLIMARYFRKATKPMIIAANKLDTKTGWENFEKIRKERKDLEIIPTSTESELVLRKAKEQGLITYAPGDREFSVIGKLNAQQEKALRFVKENVLDKFGSTGVQQCLDDAVFKLLEYIAIFPGSTKDVTDKQGRVLPDCFLLPKGTTALDFAFFLHTDFGDNFVKAIDVRTKKLLGKDTPLKSRDIIELVAGK